MLTRLRIENFKTLESADIPLGQNVVFIGPNNSGKTSALQALALWHTGVREWQARRPEKSSAKKRTGITVNRRSLTHTPVPTARLLWSKQKVNLTTRKDGKQETQNVYLNIIVDGETDGVSWTCGIQFYFGNSESIYCRLLSDDQDGELKQTIALGATGSKVAMLPPMSGLVAEEAEIKSGRIEVLIGEGQTSQVLRNLCLRVHETDSEAWSEIKAEMRRAFGVEMLDPSRDVARGTVELLYSQDDVELDLLSAGRGMQQTLLLLAHLYSNKRSVLLLDEPDAHLEILRQRQLYNLITETARKLGSQIIAASHSEILLNEAADKDVVVAFVGRPHRIDDRGSQVLKSLKEIGFDQYYQAELKGFVLYVEGSTDLAILRSFAKNLKHRSFEILDQVFVHYVLNQPKQAEHHYYGIREAKSDLRAVAIFDRLEAALPSSFTIPNIVWKRREIENYFCSKAVLLRYAVGNAPDDLVGKAEQEVRKDAMENAIKEVEQAFATLKRDPWSNNEKVSDLFMPRIFEIYFEKLKQDNRLNKSDFHILTEFVESAEIDIEIVDALDLIARVALNDSN